MTIKTVTVSDSIEMRQPNGLGHWRKYELAADITENEDEREVARILTNDIQIMHRENNPGLHVELGYVGASVTCQSQPNIIAERPSNTMEALIFDINSCTELKVLETYHLLAKKNPSIQEAYDKKLKELS